MLIHKEELSNQRISQFIVSFLQIFLVKYFLIKNKIVSKIIFCKYFLQIARKMKSFLAITIVLFLALNASADRREIEGLGNLKGHQLLTFKRTC